MPRTARNPKIDTRTARLRLLPRREPYWTTLAQGKAIGYRKGAKGGTWIARWRDPRGGQHYYSLGAADDLLDAEGIEVFSFAQAQATAREWFETVAEAWHRPQGPVTVRHAMASYLDWLKGHRRSYKATSYEVEAHIVPAFGELPVAELTTEALRQWHVSLIDTPARCRTGLGAMQQYRQIAVDPEAVRRRRATANRVLAIFKAGLNFAFRDGLVQSDAAWRRVRPFPGALGTRDRYLSVEECRRLVEGCLPDFRQMVQAALLTGCRWKELTNLLVGDFDPTSQTLTVRLSKNGRTRYVALTQEGVAFFRSVTARRDRNEWLFVKADGKKWGFAHQCRRMDLACNRAGIHPKITFHGLRHTVASLLVMSGAPLLVVARHLGHSDERMVARHYGHLAPTYVAETIRSSSPRMRFMEP